LPVSGTLPQDSNTIRRWLHEHDLFLAIVLWGVFAAALLLLARGLPARTFFAGDSGVKLIVARNAIEHPTHPLDIDLPRVGNQRVDFLDPFFHVHGDHAHAATPDFFPLISAPLIALFGMRGAFVLPALGYLLTIWAIASLGVALDERRSPTMLLVVAVACTPLLFYGLEFWEHTVAVGVAATATVLCVRRDSRLTLFISGVLLAVAALLRPEAVWYAVGVVTAARWLPRRFGLMDMAMVAAGAAVGFLPFATASAFYSGQLFGAHVTRNMSGITSGWWASRIEYLSLWFVPHSTVWLVVGAVVFVAAVAANDKERFIRIARVIGATFVTIVAIAAATRDFDRASIWNAAPAVGAVWVIPVVGGRHGQKFLFTVAAVSVVLIALTAPSDGGAQWGPRYLSVAFIPLAILTADALTATIWSSPFLGATIVAVLMVSSLMVQRNAYKDLQSAKRTYERIVQFVERETTPGSYILTDLWWFDQVTAALYPTRVVLFVDSAASAQRALGLAVTAANVFVVRSERESPHDSFGQWREGTPFVVTRQSEIPERTLTILQLSNRR
jgi:hypothetical protein